MCLCGFRLVLNKSSISDVTDILDVVHLRLKTHDSEIEYVSILEWEVERIPYSL